MDSKPDPRPVFEADQVVTFYDLMAIRNGYIYRYERTPWHDFQRRFLMRAGVGFCNELLHWLHHGKPKDGIKCNGGHNVP